LVLDWTVSRRDGIDKSRVFNLDWVVQIDNVKTQDLIEEAYMCGPNLQEIDVAGRAVLSV
jgi:hypothetical protein